MTDQARQIAERIAKRVATPVVAPRSVGSGDISSELAAMRASLGEIQNRLIQIESRVHSGAIYSEGVATPRMHSPWLAGVNANHPSEERFGVEEATVSQMVDYFQSETTCSMEPGKPCDHCSMCSSRGF